MSQGHEWDTNSPPPSPPRGVMAGTGGRNTQPKNWENPANRRQRRVNVQGARKLTDKLNRMVSDTMRFRDAELRKVQQQRQTLAEYLQALEKHMLHSDVQWRNYVNVHVKDASGKDALNPNYVQAVAGIMDQLRRPNKQE